MYFDPVPQEGAECRDGGLVENNSVHIAVDEARAIFAREAVLDLVLSLDCGKARKFQKKLHWAGSEWLAPSMTPSSRQGMAN